MHKATQSNSQDGGLFARKGSIFGGGSKRPPTRPGTSSGYTTTTSDSNGDSVASQDSTASSTSSVPPPKPSSSSNARSPQNTRRPSIEITNFSNSPEKRPEPARSRSRLRANSRSVDRRQSISQPSGDTSTQLPPAHAQSSNRASTSSTAPYSNMLAASINRNAQDYRPDLGYQTGRFGAGAMVQGTVPPMVGPQSPTLETITFQHIHEMASKRISTLDYLRKAYFAPFQFRLADTNPVYADTKDGYIGSIHYYSISQIWHECPTLTAVNLRAVQRITSSLDCLCRQYSTSTPQRPQTFYEHSMHFWLSSTLSKRFTPLMVRVHHPYREHVCHKCLNVPTQPGKAGGQVQRQR